MPSPRPDRSTVVPSLLALVPGLLLAGACGARAAPPASVLLVTMDTTVPEALGCYGGPPGVTPHLDRLAREGLVFEDARAVVPLTLPAHASILTGLYPPRTAVRRNGETRLSREALTLAERAEQAGYASAAFVSAVVLAPEFGLDQGFARYDAPETPESVEEHLAASRPASDIAARARNWLGTLEDDRPFFLWLHFYDPHFPYAPEARFRAQAGGDAYLGEVAQMDAALGDVLEQLRRDGRYENTLILALADHGEGRGRHGEETHGAFVFDSTLRIPMLARLPNGARAGERLPAPVSQVDVAPLVASVLGWPAPAGLDGRDPLGPEAKPGIYFESYFGTKSFGWSPLAGWSDGTLKYVHSSAPELYDLRADPGETRNLAAERPAEAEVLRGRVAELLTRPAVPRAALAGDLLSLQREIERLGYAGAGDGAEDEDPSPLAPSTRPSPHALTRAYAEYMEGRKIFEEKGPREEAIPLLERALESNPENHKAWFTLGLARLDLQLFGPAADAFRRVLDFPGGERIPAQLNLAVCYYNLGRREEAVEVLESALSDTPGPPGALELLARLLDECGRAEEAMRARVRARARDAKSSPTG